METDQHLTSSPFPHMSMAWAKCFWTCVIRLGGSQLPFSAMEANTAVTCHALSALLTQMCAPEFLRSAYRGPVVWGDPGQRRRWKLRFVSMRRTTDFRKARCRSKPHRPHFTSSQFPFIQLTRVCISQPRLARKLLCRLSSELDKSAPQNAWESCGKAAAFHPKHACPTDQRVESAFTYRLFPLHNKP